MTVCNLLCFSRNPLSGTSLASAQDLFGLCAPVGLRPFGPVYRHIPYEAFLMRVAHRRSANTLFSPSGDKGRVCQGAAEFANCVLK